MTLSAACDILLVEDNDDEAELAERAFGGLGVADRIVRVRDGVEALDYLFCRGAHAERAGAFPVVVLLDLKLPRLDGIGVLKAIRAEDTTRHLPVVVMTSSDHERDRLAAYGARANSYVKKPIDYDEFLDAARQISEYWVVLNVRPPRAT